MGKMKDYLIQMQENEISEIKVHWNAEGYVIIEYQDRQLIMTRSEAEQLFVDMGYCLQDMDIVKFDENGETEPCPTS